MAIYGYVRVSSADQNEDRQLIAMGELNIPDGQIYTDKISGSGFERPAYRSIGDEASLFGAPILTP
jgi:DNA invertase Pin-like site-specific DNA recombinase